MGWNIGAGPAQSVVVVTDTMIEGGPAIPVYGWVGQPTDSRPIEGAPAQRVVVIHDADLKQNGGKFYLIGTPVALPVASQVTTGIREGNIPIAVYPVNAWP